MLKFHKMRLLHPTADGGQAAASGDGEPGQATATGEGADAQPEGGQAEDEPKAENAVNMSKAEYEAALAKAKREGARDAAKAKPADPPAADGEGGEDEMQKAQAVLQQANEKLLAASVLTLGAGKKITGNGIKAAQAMLKEQLGDCLDGEGNVDEAAVGDALDDFLQEFPEFKQADPQKPQYQYEGNPKAGKGTYASKEEIMKIKDAGKRRQAIADNIHLFQ